MTRIAVVQPALALGEVEANLIRIEDLDPRRPPGAQRRRGPRPRGLHLAERLREGPARHRAPDRRPALPAADAPGARARLRASAAASSRCAGNHTYGTYVLAEPDGAAHLHDKDIPTAWEQNYYRGGDDDGVVRCETLGATVGLMSGWEWARNRTSGRVRAGGAQLVLGGMCWPSLPTNWPGPLRWLTEREHGIWREQARALPGQVARLVGRAGRARLARRARSPARRRSARVSRGRPR